MTFKAQIEIIGINPFVFVPNNILTEICKQAGRNKSPIPIKGTVNCKPYKQTLVRYKGEWRLYINTSMLKNSPKRIGETVEVSVQYDPETRDVKIPIELLDAMKDNKKAQLVFNRSPKSMQQEIARYLMRLKTKESMERNIKKTINFLEGKERFLGRDKP